MLRSKSVSSLDDRSSIVTGDSLQMALEGQWDETISIEDIHKGVLEHLTEKLENLKKRYLSLKFCSDETRKDRVVKKIVAARINYQRYVKVTKDVLEKCNDFMRYRKDTPSSRIAFIRNVQDYFSQAKEFVKLDISLKKISPTLINYVQPKTTDSPNTYRRKREMCKAMTLVANADKNCLMNSGVGKAFRSRYAQQNKFLHNDFPESWIQYLPVVLRNAIKDAVNPDQRWLYTILYLFSKHCSVNYLQQGYCPSCMFPIINFRDQGMVGGKLFCYACRKEIEWTYYMNPRTICLIVMSFHQAEIETAKENLIRSINNDPGKFKVTDQPEEENYFEEILTEYIKNAARYIDNPKGLRSATGDVFGSTDEKKFKEITNSDGDDLNGEDENDGDEELVNNGRQGAVDEEQVDYNADEEENALTRQRSSDETASSTKLSPPSTSSSTRGKGAFPSFVDVVKKANEKLSRIDMEDITTEEYRLSIEDVKNAKETFVMFKNELSAFEGRFEEQIPRGIIPKVERYVCHYYKLPPKDEVKKLPINEKGDREGTSRKMIDDALTELSLGKWSNMVSKIANKLWGSHLPDTKDHHLDILADCLVQKEIFSRMPTHGRKSNLNQRLILMYITRRYGYPWDENDFRVNFSPATLKKQLVILKEIFDIIDK